MYIGLYVKHPLFLSGFNELNCLDKFSKNTRISNFAQIRLVEAKDGHTDGQTWRI